MKPQSKDGVPLIIEASDVVKTELWQSLDHLHRLLQDRKVLVKRSSSDRFRYFDMQKNTGNFSFTKPVQEEQNTLNEFMAESEKILASGCPERLYLQETLSGHTEMADEFVSWKWELLIKVALACNWGLPDSNELFVGMVGAETPLHFDERENLFFHVRGLKEIVTYPFVDYPRLYPFPTTHPCDRQSMVGNPLQADLQAFPKFKDVVGHYAVLKAGDLLYLPYGWWHWLRNLENFAISISFWSTTPANDLSQGIPETFSDHMLTRVRRNLESMIANHFGPENLNESMLKLQSAIKNKQDEDERLTLVRKMLFAVRLPPHKQDEFMLETIEGRFGVDWSTYV